MMSRLHSLLVALVAFLSMVTVAAAATVEIPYTEYTLDNGLRLVVHQGPGTSGTTWARRTRSGARPASRTCSST